MRSVLVVQCSPCRCAISTAASQIGSGSRVRGGFALRHSSNRWLSCNKSSGTAVFSWAMPKRYYSTLHRVTHACRKLTPVAIKLLDQVLAREPDNPQARQKLLEIYSAPAFRSTEKLRLNVDSYRKACPSSLVGYYPAYL